MAALSSSSLHANFCASSSKFGFARLDKLQRRLAVTTAFNRKGHRAWLIKPVLNNRHSSINDDETTEPARILLERLFVQTQKLEEKIGKDLNLPQDTELELNLGKLESDLQAALAILKKKEEDLAAAEHKILSDYSDLNHAKEELARREDAILASSLKREKLEEELKQANLDLASKASKIEDLKLQLDKRDREMTAAQSALSLKETEMNEMINELMVKTKEAANTESQLRSKAQVLDETNVIVKKQALEIQELQKAIQEKDEGLQVSMALRKAEEEKLKAVEGTLKKQTMDWLLAQEEMRKVAEETSKCTVEAQETMEDFTRVKQLLGDVRSELVSSQRALTLSRQKMEYQHELLEKQLLELEEQRKSVNSYMTTLRDAEVEVESERVKLRLAEARKQELERDLSVERDLIKELQEHLNEEKLFLQQAIEEISILKEELDRRRTEYGEMQNRLETKESELVEAKLEIQHLKAEQASLQLMFGERELELSDARKTLGEMNQEIEDLKELLNSREDELIEKTTILREREEEVETIQHDLTDTKLKFSEAKSVVERIVELTNNMVTSIKDDQVALTTASEEEPIGSNFKWEKRQLETELEITRDTLRSREMEILAAQRALAIKDQELKMVIEKLDEREKEMREMKEELTQDGNDLKQLYALAQERIGEKSLGELAIEKLQLEAAQLEVAAATSALQKITEMSRELLEKASLSIEADINISMLNESDNGISAFKEECFAEVKSELARLSDLTAKLVEEAGIVSNVRQ